MQLVIRVGTPTDHKINNFNTERAGLAHYNLAHFHSEFRPNSNSRKE